MFSVNLTVRLFSHKELWPFRFIFIFFTVLLINSHKKNKWFQASFNRFPPNIVNQMSFIFLLKKKKDPIFFLPRKWVVCSKFPEESVWTCSVWQPSAFRLMATAIRKKEDFSFVKMIYDIQSMSGAPCSNCIAFWSLLSPLDCPLTTQEPKKQ